MEFISGAFWQDVVVTMAALGGGTVILWRVFGFFRSTPGTAPCGNCGSASGSTCASSQPAPAHDTHPVVFIRSGR